MEGRLAVISATNPWRDAAAEAPWEFASNALEKKEIEDEPQMSK